MNSENIKVYECTILHAKITKEQCAFNFEKGEIPCCKICQAPICKVDVPEAILESDKKVSNLSDMVSKSGYDRALIINLGWLLSKGAKPSKGGKLEEILKNLTKKGFTIEEISLVKNEGPRSFVPMEKKSLVQKENVVAYGEKIVSFNSRADIAKFVKQTTDTLKKIFDRLVSTDGKKGPASGQTGEGFALLLEKGFTNETFMEAWIACKLGGEGYELKLPIEDSKKPFVMRQVDVKTESEKAKTENRQEECFEGTEKPVQLPDTGTEKLTPSPLPPVAEAEKIPGISESATEKTGDKARVKEDILEMTVLWCLSEKIAELIPVGNSLTIQGKRK